MARIRSHNPTSESKPVPAPRQRAAPAPRASRSAPARAPAAPKPASAARKAPSQSPTRMNMREETYNFKRDRIVDVASALFAEYGFSNTTLDAVAEAMKTTKPTLYSYFGSKSDLLTAICDRVATSAMDALHRVIESGGSQTDKVRLFVREYMQTVLDNREAYSVFERELKHLHPEADRAITAIRKDFRHKLGQILDKGVATGEFMIDDTQMATMAIAGMISWSHVWYSPEGRLTIAQMTDRMTALILAMVQARHSEPARANRSAAARIPARPTPLVRRTAT